MIANHNDFKPIVSFKYYCKICDYGTVKKSNINNHNNSIKHIQSNIKPMISLKYCCENCNKEYKDNSGLWRHKKKCNVKKKETVVLETENKVLENNNVMNLMFAILKQNNEFKELIIEKTPTANNDELVAELLKQNNEFKELIIEQKNTPTANNDELVSELIKQNNEFKELMLEQSKYMMELASKAGNTINNKTFNLNFYLNDTCRDAINIFDFTKSIGLKLTDLEYTSKYGFVAGITNILLRGLKEIDVNKRPFNCSDIKREIIYVKDNGVWEKDDNNKSKMVKVIKQISHRNFQQIEEWRNKNPSSRDVESKKNTEYLYIMREVLGGPTTNNDANSYNKIIRNIMKEILIDKQMLK